MPEATTNPAGAESRNKPVRVFRSFGVKVSVFQNRTKKDDRELTFHKVTVQRIYRADNGFKSTSSLGRHDLPAAWMLLQKAWDYIAQAEGGRSTKEAMA